MTLLFLILLIFKVHWYSIWLALFVDALLFGMIFIFKTEENGDGYWTRVFISYVILGVALFAFYKFFCALNISAWFILLAPLYFVVCCFVPGGFLIGYQLLVHYGLMTHKLWVFILAIVISLLALWVPISTIKGFIKKD